MRISYFYLYSFHHSYLFKPNPNKFLSSCLRRYLFCFVVTPSLLSAAARRVTEKFVCLLFQQLSSLVNCSINNEFLGISAPYYPACPTGAIQIMKRIQSSPQKLQLKQLFPSVTVITPSPSAAECDAPCCCAQQWLLAAMDHTGDSGHCPGWNWLAQHSPSLMIIALASQFHIYLPWGQRPSMQ